jgi:hypothetical protein
MLEAIEGAGIVLKTSHRHPALQRNIQLDFSEEEIRDAAKTQELVRKKLLEIMDLQADIDGLLRDEHPTPFGSAKWKDARPEELQRLVLMTAIQFVLFEPNDWVDGNDKFKVTTDELLELVTGQLKWINAKYK